MIYVYIGWAAVAILICAAVFVAFKAISQDDTQ